MMVAGKLGILSGVAYWIAQCLGGIAAVYTASFVLSPNGDVAMAAISLSRGENIGVVGAMVAEAIAAFFFVTVILMTAVHKKAPTMGALFLGLVLTFCILAIGPISGGAINPAVGLALSVGSMQWDNAISWMIGPMLGAMVAALFYVAIWDKEPKVAAVEG
jgi:glycerol uptake facilitator-like aquaporin